MTPTSTVVAAAQTTQCPPDPINELTNWLLASPSVARVLTIGLPCAGMAASLFFGLPPFSTLMTGGFLLATALICHRAILTFAGATLRLLVMARVMLIFVLTAAFLGTTGVAWMALVSALVLWLVSDRLLGRRALQDLFKQGRSHS